MAWYIKGLPLNDSYQPVFRWRDPPPGFLSQKISCGTPVAPAEVPTGADQATDGESLPDILRIKGALAVPAPFRDIVDRLEPETHQLFPITLFRPSGEAVAREYFLLNVCRKIDALVIEKSDVYWNHWEQKLPDGRVILGKNVSLSGARPTIVLRKEDIIGRHLWRADVHLTNHLFFSDELMKAVQSARLKELRALQAVEE